MKADVIVVGGRVAGAGLAAMLGDRGLDVLVADKADLPGPAVSTHFFGPGVMGILASLGLADEVLAAGAPRLRNWHVEVAGMHYGGPMLIPPPYDFNICVRREVFDDILKRRAERTGRVRFLTRSPVRSLIVEDGRVTGVSGDGWSATAPVVIGADGENSVVAAQAGAGMDWDGGTWRCSAHAYWRGVKELPDPSLELWYDGADVFQFGPCDSGLWVLLISSPKEAFGAIRAGGAAGYEQRLRGLPAMASRLRDAELASPVFTLGTLRNFVRQGAGPGWFLVGDALCRRDPLFGSGFADGLRAAQFLAGVVEQLAGGLITDAEAAASYAGHITASIAEPLRDGISGLRLAAPRPGQQAWIRGLLSHPAFAMELGDRAAALIGGLPADRHEYWTTVAQHAAAVAGLPAPDPVIPAVGGPITQDAEPSLH